MHVLDLRHRHMVDLLVESDVVRFSAARMHNKFDPGYVSGDINAPPSITNISRYQFDNGIEIDWSHKDNLNVERLVLELNKDEAQHLYELLGARLKE